MKVEDIQKQLENMRTTALGLQAQAKELEATSPVSPAFNKEFQNRLMKNLDIISSEESPLDAEIKRTITGMQEAREAAETGIRAGFERERAEVADIGERRRVGTLESLRGLGQASTMAVIDQIEERTTKSIRDLDLREKQALSIGRVEEADKIANLRFRALEFSEAKKQQAFGNILQMGGFALQARQQQMQTEEFEFKRAADTLNLMRQFNLSGKIDEERARQIEGQLKLKQGTLNRIIPKANEKALQFFQDNEGNVTGIFQDENTGAIRTQSFTGIGKSESTTTKSLLSQSIKNRLVSANQFLTPDVAEGIQYDLNRRKSLPQIIQNIQNQLGVSHEDATKVVDTFREVIGKAPFDVTVVAP